jgi:hypothetical protein
MPFFRQFQHLLPQAAAWRITVNKTLRRFFEGLAGTASDARDFVDGVYDQVFPDTTDELTQWENQFGLITATLEADRRANIAAAWQETGGQSPRYIQDTLQAAGFEVFVHEWWSSGPPYVARDPRDYTEQPLIGSTQCGEALALCGEPDAQCNRFLQNSPGYFVNLNWTDVAPPPVPDDPAFWPYFLYIGGETFPDPVFIDADRRDEFERLIQKIKPAQQWIVVFDFSEFDLITEGGDLVITEGGDLVEATSAGI